MTSISSPRQSTQLFDSVGLGVPESGAQSPEQCSEAGKKDRSHWILLGGHAMVQGTQSSPEDHTD